MDSKKAKALVKAISALAPKLSSFAYGESGLNIDQLAAICTRFTSLSKLSLCLMQQSSIVPILQALPPACPLQTLRLRPPQSVYHWMPSLEEFTEILRNYPPLPSISSLDRIILPPANAGPTWKKGMQPEMKELREVCEKLDIHVEETPVVNDGGVRHDRVCFWEDLADF